MPEGYVCSVYVALLHLRIGLLLHSLPFREAVLFLLHMVSAHNRKCIAASPPASFTCPYVFLHPFCSLLKKTQFVSSIPSRGSTSRPSTPGLRGESSPPPPASVQPPAEDGSNDVTASRCENHVTWESPHTEPELTQVFQQPAFVDLHQQVCFVSFCFCFFLKNF